MEERLAPLVIAWSTRPAIYEYVRDGGREPLPDEAPPREDGLRWAPGALDGVLGHHGPGDEEELRTRQVAKALLDVIGEPTEKHLEHLERVVCRAPILGVLDDVIDAIASSELEPEAFHEFALFLVERAPRRELVKLGIAMLGVVVGADDRERLALIGRCEEFTLYAAVALAAVAPEADRALFDLARQVDGWGRIHCVERLVDTEDREIQGWLLREGFRNDVLDEYLAYPCAVGGELAKALDVDEVDDELLDGAGAILSALLAGGPAEDIDDYQDALAAASGYLRQLHARGDAPVDVGHLAVSADLVEWLGVRREGEASSTEKAMIDGALERASEVMAREHWRGSVEAGLESEDEAQFMHAEAAARVLGIDTWPQHVRRIRAAPRESESWFVLAQGDPARVGELVELARELLPLDEIATGPAEESGFDGRWRSHEHLGAVLAATRGESVDVFDLIAAGLESPVVGVRHAALECLETREDLAPNEKALLEAHVSREPVDEFEQRGRKLLGE